eukprot:TRINITY_DN29718_c0_g1_i1.p1 TRINITY_DN29718_c0_g1~~TRINITY_DN29718_c0_g1_i1.p1  ORF type:complete len:274 (-),score=37.69 TRINITY_DN29718_c0_g1_i1:143-964(-)
MRVSVRASLVASCVVFACSLLVLTRAALSTCGTTVGNACMAQSSSVGTTMREIRDPKTFAAFVFAPLGSVPLRPLLLYLHGAGESGHNLDDLISEGATGTPPVSLKYGRALPVLYENFVVVAPQTSRGWRASDITHFLDFLTSDGSGVTFDPKRVYVTGHSMGGYGALIAGTTGRFAAVVPVAPAGAVQARDLQGVPVWAFHGKNDVIVPSTYSDMVIKGLKDMGASEDEARLTLYENAPAPPGWPEYYGHASTIPAYATGELYEWLLEKRLD